ncbi:MAG: SDR family oxidoreductase [Dehalococcoidia bacterium]|nr:SDR family oxidoreductase [Dehalococcoidia bacterium]
MYALTGRVALITGGGRGIGRAIALRLAREGAAVAVNYRQGAEAAGATVSEARSAGVEARIYQCDVAAGFEAVQKMVDQVVSEFGGLDIVINNAGMLPERRTLHDSTTEQFLETFDNNFLSALHVTRAALPHLRRQKRGHVIFISSTTLAERPPYRAPYVAGKLAMEGLASVVAMEELPHGIHVNVIRCGTVATEMGVEMLRSRGVDDFESLNAVAPFGRIIHPEEVGNLAVFLCSDEALHVNNTVVTIDGGSQGWLPPRLPTT